MGNNPCTLNYATGEYECPPSRGGVKSYVDQKLSSHNIVMVSKTNCRACKSAKRLFNTIYQELGEWPTVVEIDQYSEGRQKEILKYLKTKSGRITVPQIFFNGEFVGGNSECQRLHMQRQLIGKYKMSSSQSNSSSTRNGPNILRLSPMMTIQKPIRTEPILSNPTEIQEYLTEFPTVSESSIPFTFDLGSAPKKVRSTRNAIEEKSDDWQPLQYSKSANYGASSSKYNKSYNSQQQPLQPVQPLETYGAYDEIKTITTDANGVETEELELRPAESSGHPATAYDVEEVAEVEEVELPAESTEYHVQVI